MTRINCIDPILLNDAALGAEYRELPRVFGLVRKAAAKGLKPTDLKIPKNYTLGKGHVLFFYDKLLYLMLRYDNEIVPECRIRGRKVAYPTIDTTGIPVQWFGGWVPTREAIILNYERIKERGGLRDYE